MRSLLLLLLICEIQKYQIDENTNRSLNYEYISASDRGLWYRNTAACFYLFANALLYQYPLLLEVYVVEYKLHTFQIKIICMIWVKLAG